MYKYLTLFFLLNTFVALGQNDTVSNTPIQILDSIVKPKKDISIELLGYFGAGLVRNTISPTLASSIRLNSNKNWKIAISTNSYFLFNQDSTRKYKTLLNTFLNTEFLKLGFGLKDKNQWGGLGVGYLIQNNGGYFGGNTFKIYSITGRENCMIVSELIFTNDFKTMFPGITIRF